MGECIWVEPPSPEGAWDILTEILRKGAKEVLRQAGEAELEAHLQAHAHRRLRRVNPDETSASIRVRHVS